MGEKILAVHQGALGDVILSFHALADMKSARGAALDLLCSNGIGLVARALGVADTCFHIDGARFCALFGGAVTPELADFFGGYDRVVLIGLSPEMRDHLGAFYGGERNWMTSRPPVDKEIHVAHHVFQGFQRVGLLTWQEKLLGQGPPKQQGPWGLSRPSVKDKGIVVLHAGAGSRRKRWGVERFMEVADNLSQLGWDIRFLLGPAERDLLAPRAVAAFSESCLVHHTDDLGEVMDLLADAVCFVGNDSGLTHLAAYMGMPTVSIFGPTDPKRWAPLGKNVIVLRGATACRPCFETETSNCSEPTCLSEVTVEMVLDGINGMLR